MAFPTASQPKHTSNRALFLKPTTTPGKIALILQNKPTRRLLYRPFRAEGLSLKRVTLGLRGDKIAGQTQPVDWIELAAFEEMPKWGWVRAVKEAYQHLETQGVSGGSFSVDGGGTANHRRGFRMRGWNEQAVGTTWRKCRIYLVRRG